ncbi:MAG: alpha/beta fold hydrolase [Bdellovibrionales bacterium]
MKSFSLFLCMATSLAVHHQAQARHDDVRPLWTEKDLECPAVSATDRYIDVPTFHDLGKVAHIERIPGLKVHKEMQDSYADKKLRIYYELFRPWDSNKELLILIPGGPGETHATFHVLVTDQPEFLERFNVIAMDHRGVGCSRPLFPGNEPDEALLMRQAASDIDLIRRELVGASGSINVWGYSYGSILAQTYALLYPEHLDRLFLGGSVSSFNDWHLAGLQYESLVFSAVKDEAREEFEALTKESPEIREQFLVWAFTSLYSYWGRVKEIPGKLETVVRLLRSGQKAAIAKELKPEDWVLPWMMRSISCTELFPYEAKYPGEFPMFKPILESCREFQEKHEYFNYTPLLKQIDRPTLIFGGNFDHVTPAPAMLRIAQEISGSFIFIDPYMGHSFRGKRECLSKLMLEFFSGASNEKLEEVAYSGLCQRAPPSEEPQEESNKK